jgi:hypothetical protein
MPKIGLFSGKININGFEKPIATIRGCFGICVTN